MFQEKVLRDSIADPTKSHGRLTLRIDDFCWKGRIALQLIRADSRPVRQSYSSLLRKIDRNDGICLKKGN